MRERNKCYRWVVVDIQNFNVANVSESTCIWDIDMKLHGCLFVDASHLRPAEKKSHAAPLFAFFVKT